MILEDLNSSVSNCLIVTIDEDYENGWRFFKANDAAWKDYIYKIYYIYLVS